MLHTFHNYIVGFKNVHFVLILYTPVYNMLSEFNIADSEMLNVLLNLDTTKAMGPDGIPPIVLQRCATALYQPRGSLLFI